MHNKRAAGTKGEFCAHIRPNYRPVALARPFLTAGMRILGTSIYSLLIYNLCTASAFTNSIPFVSN